MVKVRVPVVTDGQRSDELGELMNIVKQSEPWSEYVLEDGTIIRTKQTLMQLVKMDKVGPDGKSIYSMQTQPSIVVIPSVVDE